MEIRGKFPTKMQKNGFNLLILALFTILYAPLIIYWFDGWLNKSINIEHEYFSHGMIGLPFAAYITWHHRQQWSNLANYSHPLGAFFLTLAAVFYLTGVREFVNLSFPLILLGICLWLKGIPGLKLQAFPLLLVFLATPNSVPYLITPYTLPLQKFIAGCAGLILTQLGLDVTVEQIYLAVGGRLVEVAPYCAGLKMLFTSLYVTLMLLYWTNTLANKRKTTLMLLSAAIISVIGNIIRNTFLTYFHGTGNEAMFEWLHDGWGGDVYSAGMLGIIVLLMRLVSNWESDLTTIDLEEVSNNEKMLL